MVFGTVAPSTLAFVPSRVFCTKASSSALSTRVPRIGSKVACSSFLATSISNPIKAKLEGLGRTRWRVVNERDAQEQEGLFGISHDYYALVITLSFHLQSPMSSDKKTPDGPNKASSLETDVSTLASLIASTATNGDRTNDPETVEGEVEELGVEEVEELIRRLEAADGIADGVENKLDGILEHLDGLLKSLEANKEAKDGSPTDSQPDR